jgi:hypothetical protein
MPIEYGYPENFINEGMLLSEKILAYQWAKKVLPFLILPYK